MASIQLTQSILYEVQQALLQLSLSKPTGVYDSEDENALLMGSAANLAGVLVNGAYDWQSQRRTLTLNGDDTRTNFDLPTDFERFIDDTGWSSLDQCKVHPLNPQQWQQYVNNLVQFPEIRLCQLEQDQLIFANPPPLGDVITFKYISKEWVMDADNPSKLKTIASKNGDTPKFDWVLMVLAIKVKWLEAKHMDTTGPMNDFMDRIQQLTRGERYAPPLYIGQAVPSFRYLGPGNIPLTDFGGPDDV